MVDLKQPLCFLVYWDDVCWDYGRARVQFPAASGRPQFLVECPLNLGAGDQHRADTTQPGEDGEGLFHPLSILFPLREQQAVHERVNAPLQLLYRAWVGQPGTPAPAASRSNFLSPLPSSTQR